MNQPAPQSPLLKLVSRPKHLRHVEQSEKWQLELVRPFHCNRGVLTIDLHAYQPAPHRHAHFGHWGYIIEAEESSYSIEFNQSADAVELTLNGRALEVYKRDWLPHSGNGFYV